MTKTERLIDRIKKVEKFYDVAFLCEDFQTFVDEIQEWGVYHICGVDFDDPDLNLIMQVMRFSVLSVVHLATPTPVASMLQQQFTKVLNMKNLHIEHPEDTILTGDLSVLDAFQSDNHYSVKIDGSPAIVWGTDPENGKFFVGTKSVFNKRTPKVNYSNAGH